MSRDNSSNRALPSTGPTGALILASGSPRRRDLLRRAGVRFEIHPADIPEDQRPGEEPLAYACRMAREKALAVAVRVGASPARWILGADTIVSLDGDILQKPENTEHAVRLLSRLTGRRHTVVTAMALVASDDLHVHGAHVTSEVAMREAEMAEVLAYAETGEALDKAGGYAAQGDGRRFIESIDGSETNVIGLPIDETLELLRGAGAILERSGT